MATDSYRLSRKVIYLDNSNYGDLNIVIPGKNLVELSKMMDDDSNVELHIFSNKVLFKYKNILFLSRLLSGTYPATSSIIPRDFSISIDCNANILYEMIDRASLLTSDREKNTIKLVLEGGILTILSNSPEIGKVEEKLTVNCNNEISISFSSKYMLDAIKSFSKDNITININSDNSPIILNSSEDDSLVQLVLPIKTY
jgi:DNA polymerase-3 subunit beta